MTALTISDGFSTLRLTERAATIPVVRPPQAAPKVVSIQIPDTDAIEITPRASYRMSAEEYGILDAALEDAVQVRTVLTRD